MATGRAENQVGLPSIWVVRAQVAGLPKEAAGTSCGFLVATGMGWGTSARVAQLSGAARVRRVTH